MVGVAGRSKGCHTCRRRKIRCDQRKPHCERCERTGRECEGYARGTIFLNQTGFGSVPERSRQSSSPSEGDARIQIFAATAETYKRKTGQKSMVKDEGGLLSPAPSVASPLSSSNVSLYQSASSSQLDSMCLNRICPLPSQQKAFSLTILAPQILSGLKQEPVFRHSFNALKLSMPYGGLETPDMILQSRVEYGHALREMQRAIATQGTDVSDQTLLACTMLKQYELQEVSSRTTDTFDAHVNGHLQLIKMRSSASLKTTFGRSSVREIRYLDILSSLSTHGRGQLTSSEWRCPTTWTDDHDIRLSLLDVAADAGGVFEDFEIMGAECAYTDRQTLLSRASQVHQELYIWHQRLLRVTELSPPWPDSEEAPNFHEWQPSVNISNPSDRKIEIDDLEQKYLMLDFWAISIIANQLSDRLAAAWPQQAHGYAWPLQSPPRSLEDRQIRLASNMLKICGPCIADECGMWGMLRSVWGLRNAYAALKKLPSRRAAELVRELEQILARIAARDFRMAPLSIEAPSPTAIESSYSLGSGLSKVTSGANIELPDILARDPV